MSFTYGRTSLLLLGISVLLLIMLTLFESALVGTSQTAQRVITVLALVVPATIGTVAGIMSIVRKEGQRWLTVIGTLLNALFAIFHLLIVFFAG